MTYFGLFGAPSLQDKGAYSHLESSEDAETKKWVKDPTSAHAGPCNVLPWFFLGSIPDP